MSKILQFVLVLLSLAVLVAVLMLVGCNGSSSSNSSGASSSLAGSFSTSSDSSSKNASTSALSSSSSSTKEVEFQIIADESLTQAMNEAQELYTKQNPNITFKETQYKSSGELNSMLQANSATADIEITASKMVMDEAEDTGYINAETRVTMFTNELDIVTSENNTNINKCALDDIATGKYTVCVCDDSIPVGNYANQSLSTVGCFIDPANRNDSYSNGDANGIDAYVHTPLEGKVLTDSSGSEVCKHVESGDVDVAIVYSTDVERFGGVKVVGIVPNDTHKTILYQGAVCTQSKNADAAERFLNWCLTNKSVQEVWQKWGFNWLPEQ